MKKILLLVAMVLGLSLASQAQTSIRFALEAAYDYDYDTGSWTGPVEFTESNYIEYVQGEFFHIHLPELNQDYSAAIIQESSTVDEDGDTVFAFGVAGTKTGTEIAMFFKIVVSPDPTKPKYFYITVPGKFNFGFKVKAITNPQTAVRTTE